MPRKRTDKPLECSFLSPAWYKPTTPLFASPVRMRRMLVLPLWLFGFLSPSTNSLSVGMIGIPLQRIKVPPAICAVTGGTPLLVHSRSNAAIVSYNSLLSWRCSTKYRIAHLTEATTTYPVKSHSNLIKVSVEFRCFLSHIYHNNSVLLPVSVQNV